MSENRNRISQIFRRAIPIVILIAACVGAYFYWRHVEAKPTTEAPVAAQGPMAVSVIVVEPETVPLHPRFLGQTEGSQIVEIRARVAGYILERFFKEGERVEKGKKLFQIDPRPFRVELEQAKARLQSAEAKLDRARQQLKRYQELATRQSATTAELEEWEKEEKVAVADVELQKALITGADLQLSYTTIESPITGMIGKALKEVGSYVDAGPTGLLAVVQQVDPIYVRYSISEQEVLRFRRQVAAHEIDAPATDQLELDITLADGTRYPHPGRINFIDVEIDRTTGTSVIRGQLPNPDNLLKPGQFVYANILGIRRVNVIRVPQKAVLQSPAGASVFVVNDREIVESRPVTLGEWSEDKWIIEKGLAPGQRIVVDRLMMVRPGIPVVATIATPTTQPVEAAAGNQPIAGENNGDRK